MPPLPVIAPPVPTTEKGVQDTFPEQVSVPVATEPIVPLLETHARFPTVQGEDVPIPVALLAPVIVRLLPRTYEPAPHEAVPAHVTVPVAIAPVTLPREVTPVFVIVNPVPITFWPAVTLIPVPLEIVPVAISNNETTGAAPAVTEIGYVPVTPVTVPAPLLLKVVQSVEERHPG